MSSIKPDNGSSKINCSEKILRPLIVACGNGSVLLECGKEVFNEMPCFVQVLIIITRSSTITLGRNHCHLALLLESLNHTFIGIYPLSVRSVSAESSLSRTSAPSRSQEESRSQMKADWIAQSINRGMNLGTQSAFAATDGFARRIPPFAAELCWWERTMVESIMAYSLSASLAK